MSQHCPTCNHPNPHHASTCTAPPEAVSSNALLSLLSDIWHEIDGLNEQNTDNIDLDLAIKHDEALTNIWSHLLTQEDALRAFWDNAGVDRQEKAT
jgi:hypothetical protein